MARRHQKCKVLKKENTESTMQGHQYQNPNKGDRFGDLPMDVDPTEEGPVVMAACGLLWHYDKKAREKRMKLKELKIPKDPVREDARSSEKVTIDDLDRWSANA